MFHLKILSFQWAHFT